LNASFPRGGLPREVEPNLTDPRSLREHAKEAIALAGLECVATEWMQAEADVHTRRSSESGPKAAERAGIFGDGDNAYIGVRCIGQDGAWVVKRVDVAVSVDEFVAHVVHRIT
jgi:hypothetical protein